MEAFGGDHCSEMGSEILGQKLLSPSYSWRCDKWPASTSALGIPWKGRGQRRKEGWTYRKQGLNVSFILSLGLVARLIVCFLESLSSGQGHLCAVRCEPWGTVAGSLDTGAAPGVRRIKRGGGVCGVGWWGRVLRNAGLEVGLLGISCLLRFSSCRGIR